MSQRVTKDLIVRSRVSKDLIKRISKFMEFETVQIEPGDLRRDKINNLLITPLVPEEDLYKRPKQRQMSKFIREAIEFYLSHLERNSNVDRG